MQPKRHFHMLLPLAFVLAAAGWLAWTAPLSAAEQLIDQGWQSYTDADGRFTLLYPPDWHVQQEVHNPPSGDARVLLRQVEFADAAHTTVRFSVWPREPGQSAEAWWSAIATPQFGSPVAQRAVIGGADAVISYPQPSVRARAIIVAVVHNDMVLVADLFAPVPNQSEDLFRQMLQQVGWPEVPEATTTLPAFLPLTDDAEVFAVTPAVASCCGVSSPGNPFPCDSPNNNGNCTWWAFHRRPDVPATCRLDAHLWANCMRGQGYPVDNTPQAGDIIVYPCAAGTSGCQSNGYVQHVAYVESVNSYTSTTIDYVITQMSWGYTWNGVYQRNICNDATRNGTPYRISNQARSKVEFIHRKGQTPVDITPPTITFTGAPQAGRWYNTNQRIDWSVSDASGVWGFSQAWDGTPTGPPPQFPGISAGWLDFNSVGEGVHTVRVRAWDNSANKNHVAAELGWFGYDTSLPGGNLTAPHDNSVTHLASVSLSANASDSRSGVERVEFYVRRDGQWALLATDAEAPYSATWSAAGVTDQQLAFSLHVVDRAGNRAVDPGGYRYVTLDRTAPTVMIEPLATMQTNDTFTVSWGGSDNLTGIVGYDVEYSVSGGAWQPWLSGQSRTSASFTGANGASYTFRVRARDSAGNYSGYILSGATTVQVAQPDAYEIDNTLASARWFDLHGVQQHNFHVAGDEDWITFWSNPGIPLTLRTTNLDSGVDTVIEVYDAADNLITSNDDWGGDWSSRVDLLDDTAGRYLYARVRPFGGATGANTGYTLILERGDEHEPDNTGDTAALVDRNESTTRHTAHVPGDRDYIRFIPYGGLPYTLMTNQLGASSDTVLELQTSAGAIMNDDAPGIGLASRIDFISEAGMTASVRQYSAFTYGPDTSYDLILARGDPNEHDNTPEQATPLAIDGTPALHTAHVPGDVDWHRLDVPAGMRLAISAMLDGSTADVTLTLYDTDAVTVLAQDLSYNPVLDWEAPATGTYYLRVAQWRDTSFGTATAYRVSAVGDNIAPTGSVAVEAPYTRSDRIALQLAATDEGTGVTEMELVVYDEVVGEWVYSGWMPYAESFDYQLGGGDGERLIWAHFLDKAGNISEWSNVLVVLDRIAPVASLRVVPAEEELNGVLLEWSAADSGAGVERVVLWWRANDGAWQKQDIADTGSAGAMFYGVPGGAHEFRLSVTDRAGNQAAEVSGAAQVSACAGDASEPDDGPAAARDVTLPFSAPHTVCGQGDTDWVALNMRAGRTYVIETRALAHADTMVTLFAGDGVTALMENDDADATTLASRIVWQAPETGRYFVRVRDFNVAIAGSAVQYTLSVSDTGGGSDTSARVYLPLTLRPGTVGVAAVTPQRQAKQGVGASWPLVVTPGAAPAAVPMGSSTHLSPVSLPPDGAPAERVPAVQPPRPAPVKGPPEAPTPVAPKS